MRVPVYHRLSREEVRARLKSRSHEIADAFPGGMAEITTQWPDEDHMTMAVSAMGQHLVGGIEIEDGQVVIELDLPPALRFLEPIIGSTVLKQSEKLLAGPKG